MEEWVDAFGHEHDHGETDSARASGSGSGVGASSSSEKVDLGPLIGASRGFRTRLKKGGRGEVEMAPQAPSTLSVSGAHASSRPQETKGNRKGKGRAMDHDEEMGHGEEGGGRTLLLSTSASGNGTGKCFLVWLWRFEKSRILWMVF